MAQQPDPFGRQFIPSERNRGITWGPDDRLAFVGQKLFFDARLSGTGTTACASCHDPSYAFAEPRRLARRYLTTNAAFLLMTARELIRRTPATGSANRSL